MSVPFNSEVPERIDEDAAIGMKAWLRERTHIFAAHDVNRIDVFYNDDGDQDSFIYEIEYRSQSGFVFEKRQKLAAFAENEMRRLAEYMIESDSFFKGEHGSEGTFRMFPNGLPLYGTSDPVIELAHRERIVTWHAFPVEVF